MDRVNRIPGPLGDVLDRARPLLQRHFACRIALVGNFSAFQYLNALLQKRQVGVYPA
jgi:hypothetical protein